MTTSSPRLWRRMASLSIEYVLPTPGAYPRKSLKTPVFLGGVASSSHCSGVFCITPSFCGTASEKSIRYNRARGRSALSAEIGSTQRSAPQGRGGALRRGARDGRDRNGNLPPPAAEPDDGRADLSAGCARRGEPLGTDP